jgi:multidrug resistance efflux pump
MATPFRQTLRALERGRHRPWLVVGGALAIVAAWLAWFVAAEVEVTDASTSGRVESDAEARSIQAPVAGTVVAHHLEVGTRVTAGQPMLELDAAPLRLERDERAARLAGLEAEAARLAEQLDGERAVVAQLEREGSLAVREAESSLRGARAGVDLASSEASRAAELHREGASSQSELERATARSATAGADLDALRLRVDRLRAAGRLRTDERRIRVGELERLRDAAVAAVAVERSAIARLEHEIERRVVRSPADGVIGAVAPARVGSYLAEGDPVATLVPDGELRAVARFPASAAGRLRPGQAVVLRFPAYPWTAYGSRRGVVVRVASELSGELLAAEIDLAPDPASTIPLAHGLELTAEVTTERLSPARLLLRNAGALLDRDRR